MHSWSQVWNDNTIIKPPFHWTNRKNKFDIHNVFKLNLKSPSKLVIFSQMVFWSSTVIFPFLLDYSSKQVFKFRGKPDSTNPPTQFYKHSEFYMWYHSVINLRPMLSPYSCTVWTSLVQCNALSFIRQAIHSSDFTRKKYNRWNNLLQ